MSAMARIGSAALAVGMAGAATGADPALGPVSWRRLELSASKLLLSATTTLTVDRVRAEQVAAVLRTPPEGVPLPPPGPEVVTLTLVSELPFGRREQTTVWLDASTGAALQGHKVVTGRKPYEKVFRYTKEGFFFWRASPASDGEEGLGPAGWSKRRSRLVRAAAALPEGAVVTDSYALLYLASAARLDRQGGSLQVMLLADEQPVELVFASGGLEQSALEYRERGVDGSRSRTREVLQRVVTVKARPTGGPAGSSDVDLGFLGLRGAVRVYLEVGTGLPLRLEGRADTIGDLRVGIEAVEWAGTLPATPSGGQEK